MGGLLWVGRCRQTKDVDKPTDGCHGLTELDRFGGWTEEDKLR